MLGMLGKSNKITRSTSQHFLAGVQNNVDGICLIELNYIK